jgi:hypothetical protein
MKTLVAVVSLFILARAAYADDKDKPNCIAQDADGSTIVETMAGTAMQCSSKLQPLVRDKKCVDPANAGKRIDYMMIAYVRSIRGKPVKQMVSCPSAKK